jgi:hypothetical protein
MHYFSCEYRVPVFFSFSLIQYHFMNTLLPALPVLPAAPSPPPKPATRREQPAHRPYGNYFESPRKKRRPRQNAGIVQRPGHALKHARLLAKLQILQCSPSPQTLPQEVSIERVDIDLDLDLDAHLDDSIPDSEETAPTCTVHQIPPPIQPNHKTIHDTMRIYDGWKQIIPSLVPPLLRHIQNSSSQATPTSIHIPSCSSCDETKTFSVLCLFWDRKCIPFLRLSFTTPAIQITKLLKFPAVHADRLSRC